MTRWYSRHSSTKVSRRRKRRNYTVDHPSLDFVMKTWASMHKFGDQAAELAGRLPFYDRSVIEDSKGLEGIFLKDLQLLEDDPSLEAWDLDGRSDVVRATFTFSRNQLDGLRHRVASRTSSSSVRSDTPIRRSVGSDCWSSPSSVSAPSTAPVPKRFSADDRAPRALSRQGATSRDTG